MESRNDILDEALAAWRKSNNDESLSPSARADAQADGFPTRRARFVEPVKRAWTDDYSDIWSVLRFRPEY